MTTIKPARPPHVAVMITINPRPVPTRTAMATITTRAVRPRTRIDRDQAQPGLQPRRDGHDRAE